MKKKFLDVSYLEQILDLFDIFTNSIYSGLQKVNAEVVFG